MSSKANSLIYQSKYIDLPENPSHTDNQPGTENDINSKEWNFGLAEYADTVGPQGKRYFLLKPHFEIFQDWIFCWMATQDELENVCGLLWWLLVAFGVFKMLGRVIFVTNICHQHIVSHMHLAIAFQSKCAKKYFEYPSVIKPTKNSDGLVRFPKILACLNVSLNPSWLINYQYLEEYAFKEKNWSKIPLDHAIFTPYLWTR